MARKRKQVAASRQAQPGVAPKPDRLLVFGTVPLRLFLGLTFVYAGLQKISDPGFLQPGASTYIGTQLQSFATQSPIGFVIEWFALPEPQLTGIAVIATELVVGTLVLLGISTRWVAAVGSLLSFVLFLTASWSVQPYFLGSDSIYTVAWITLVIVGDQGVFTARPLFLGEQAPSQGRLADPARRRLLLQLGAGAVGAVWVLALLPRRRTLIAAVSPSASPTAGTASPTASATPTGTRIGSIADLQARGSLAFNDPATGDPGLAVQLSGGNVVAYDAVCTHAGCQVNYDSSQRLLICPCHGAEFDPAHAAAVVAGPAPTPLAPITIQVASDGEIYAG